MGSTDYFLTVQRLRITVSLLGLLAGGCQRQGAVPAGGVTGNAIRTDSTTYTARRLSAVGEAPRYGFRVIAQYVNTRATPVFLERCGARGTRPVYSVTLERAAGPRQGAAYNPVWGCGWTPGLRVEAGTARVDTFDLQGPNVGVTELAIPQGPMRLWYSAFHCAEMGATCRLPGRAARSDTFTVWVK